MGMLSSRYQCRGEEEPDSKDKIPQQLQSAMINLYKADKYKCTKHMAAMDGTSITYSDKSCEGCKKAAVSRSKHRAKKFESDPDAMHGPPDRQTHFKKSTTKRYIICNYCLAV